MKRQIGFAEAESLGKKRVTKRQRFLAEMEKVVRWQRLLSVIGPHYPKGERGRPPVGLERMLRIYFLEQWYGLSGEGLEDALYDSIAMRAFAGIDMARENVPDATTLLKFRRLLVAHELTRKLFDEIGIELCERGLIMKQGTLVDATIAGAYLTLISEDAPQRRYELREMFNALRWMARAGASWRMLPNDFPRWQLVYQQTQRWLNAGCFEAMVNDLRSVLRVAQERQGQPGAVILDGRTLQSTCGLRRPQAQAGQQGAHGTCSFMPCRLSKVPNRSSPSVITNAVPARIVDDFHRRVERLDVADFCRMRWTLTHGVAKVRCRNGCRKRLAPENPSNTSKYP
jgi:hypothetical protein